MQVQHEVRELHRHRPGCNSLGIGSHCPPNGRQFDVHGDCSLATSRRIDPPHTPTLLRKSLWLDSGRELGTHSGTESLELECQGFRRPALLEELSWKMLHQSVGLPQLVVQRTG